MTWLIIAIIVILIIILAVIGMYNRIIELKQKTDDALKTVDENLTKRFELIPDLIDTVKDAMKYEDKIISEISNAKDDYFSATCVEEKSKALEILITNLNSLFTLSEAYPELNENNNFFKIQEELNLTQNDFENSIKFYNDAARTYNTAIFSFPKAAVAHLFKFEKAGLFEK